MRARVQWLFAAVLWLGGPSGCAVDDAGTGTDAGASGAGAGWPACSERSTQVSADQATGIGATSGELLAFVDGARSNVFSWVDGTRTVVRITVSDAHVFAVRSRVNPSRDPSLASVRCTDYVRIEARLTLSTDDDGLAETVENMTMYAYGYGEVRGTFQYLKSERGGSYEPRLRGERCYVASSFRVLFALDGIHGSMTDAIRSAPCESDESAGVLPFAAGHWGSHWQNY